MKSTEHPQIEALLAEQHWLHNLARTLVRDPNAAADLEQETWLAALNAPPGFLDGGRGWLRTVIARVANRKRNEEGLRDQRERWASRSEALPSSERAATRAENVKALVEATLELDEPFRQVVLLRYFENLQPTQIAAQLGIPASTVRSRLTRAHRKLRESLTGIVEESDLRAEGGLLAVLRRLVPSISSWGAPRVALVSAGLVLSVAMLGFFGWGARQIPPSNPAREVNALARDGVDPSVEVGVLAAAPLADEERRALEQGSEASRRVAIRGRIAAPDGTPIPRARILIVAEPGTDSAPVLGTSDSGADSLESRIALELRSDAEGLFDVPMKFVGERHRQRRSTPYFVACEATGFTRVTQSLEAGQSIELRPEWVVRFDGLVRDAESLEPIADVEVHYGPDQLRTRTDSRGRFRFDGVPAYQGRRVQLRHPDFVAADLPAPLVGANPEALEFTLESGKRVDLRFVDASTGAPVPGVRVFAGEHGDAFSVAEDDGRASWRVAEQGSQCLRGEGDGYANFLWRFRSEELTDERVLTLPMMAPAALRGFVVDSEGRPVAGAVVSASHSGDTEPRPVPGLPGALLHTMSGIRERPDFNTAQSDGEGRFELSLLERNSPWKLRARTRTATCESHRVESIQETPRLILLAKPEKIQVIGRVTRGGKPWTRELSLRLQGSAQAYARTREDGGFEFHVVPMGNCHLIYGGRSLRELHLGRDASVVQVGDVELDSLPRLILECQSAAGQPVVDHQVMVHHLGLGPHAFEDDHGFPRATFRASTDAEGRCEWLLPSAGDYLVRLLNKTTLHTERIRVTRDAQHQLIVPRAQTLYLRLSSARSGVDIALDHTLCFSTAAWRRPGELDTHVIRGEARHDGTLELVCPAGPIEIFLRPTISGFETLLLDAATLASNSEQQPTAIALRPGVTLDLTVQATHSPDLASELDFYLVHVSDLQLVRDRTTRAEAALLAASGESPRFRDPRLMLQEVQIREDPRTWTLEGLTPGSYTLVGFDAVGLRSDLQFEPPTFEVTASRSAAQVTCRLSPRANSTSAEEVR